MSFEDARRFKRGKGLPLFQASRSVLAFTLLQPFKLRMHPAWEKVGVDLPEDIDIPVA